MNKILVLTPRFPYPVIGGDRLRIYEICRELSKSYELTLITFCENNAEMNYTVPDDNVFKDIHRVLLPKYQSYYNCFLSLFSKTPLQVAYYKSFKFSELVDKLAHQHSVIFPHLIRVADYVKDLPNKKVLEMTDAISMNYSRFSQAKDNNTGIKGLIYQLEEKRLNTYEKKIACLFDYNFLVSQYDKNYLFDKGTEVYDKTLVCSNGVDLAKLSYQFSPTKMEVVFIGNMYSSQNLDAVLWFAINSLPLLRKYGDFKFKVIGKIKVDDKQKLEGFNGVIVTGTVDDVSSFARGAIAGLCSVRLAAGVQNKILEYMALGLPTITTSTGLEGLECIPDKDLLIADTSEQFVEQILKLYYQQDYAFKISQSAYHYVQLNHSWASKLKPILDAVDELS